jgi:RimJ/RimL family protein N-acetyltransferase
VSVEAARAVIAEAFASRPALRRIRAHTDARNLGSIRVLAKLGFTHEGTLRQNQYKRGEPADEAIFGLLRAEWSG